MATIATSRFVSTLYAALMTVLLLSACDDEGGNATVAPSPLPSPTPTATALPPLALSIAGSVDNPRGTREPQMTAGAEGSRVYLLDGSGLKVIDVSDINAPLVRGGLIVDVNLRAIAVSGTFVYLTGDDSRLRVVDVSDATSPVEVGSVELPDGASRVAVAGGVAAVLGTEGQLQLVDVSNPGAPQFASSIAGAGQFKDVAVSGSLTYAVGTDLAIFDHSDLATPVLVGGLSLYKPSIRIALDGAVAYILSYDGTELVDVNHPDAPISLGLSGLSGPVRNSIAYNLTVAEYADVEAYDVSDPQSAQFLGRLFVSFYTTEIALADTTVVAISPDRPLRLLDFSTPTAPSAAGKLKAPGYALDVALNGGYAYVADGRAGLRVIDVGEPRSPELVRTLEPGDSRYIVRRLARSENTVLVVNDIFEPESYESGYVLEYYDTTNPAAPVRSAVGQYQIDDYISDVAVSGSRAYLLRYGSVSVVDLSDPTRLDEVDSFVVPIGSRQTAVADGRLYVNVQDDFALDILDLSGTQLGRVKLPKPGRFDRRRDDVFMTGLKVAGNTAYVSYRINFENGDTESALLTINVRSPAEPTVAGKVDVAGTLISVSDAKAYLSVRDSEDLVVVDVSRRARPTIVGSIAVPGDPTSVAVADDFAFVASGARLLQVIDLYAD